jgi:hypothetical protein
MSVFTQNQWSWIGRRAYPFYDVANGSIHGGDDVGDTSALIPELPNVPLNVMLWSLLKGRIAPSYWMGRVGSVWRIQAALVSWLIP